MITLHMILLLGSLALGGLFLWLFIWAVRSGQFKDPEEAKYLLFREDDDEAETDPPRGTVKSSMKGNEGGESVDENGDENG
jgi:cbb3-type cytochrome oxidase maturation protein